MNQPILRAGFAAILGLCVAPDSLARTVTFDERVNAQEAIERVRHAHQDGETRPFETVFPRAVLESEVRKYLKESAALDAFWDTPITADALREELSRMTESSRMPERLAELRAALGDDSILVQECLVRPVLADRLARKRFAGDAVLSSGVSFDAWLRDASPALDEASVSSVAEPVPLAAASCVPDDTWDGSSLAELPESRYSHAAVWTGNVMVVWGGTNFGNITSGARYDPATDQWTSMSSVGAPEARTDYSTIWTGSKMIVWGGAGQCTATCPRYLGDGARYDPLTDSWSPTAATGAPAARGEQLAVWTGTEMLIWGGVEWNEATHTTTILNSGSRYNPVSNTWHAISNNGTPQKRMGAVAVWAGSRMIVWGGQKGTTYLNDGSGYDPATNTWSAISVDGAPSARRDATAVWTGAEMLVWGGGAGGFDTTGGRYDPTTNTWTSMSTSGAPSGRTEFTTSWTGTEMIVWGGDVSFGSTVRTNTGARYRPATDTWTPTSSVGVPKARANHTAVWTGSEMIVWGGRTEGSNNSLPAGSGGRYHPATDTWTPTALSHTPAEVSRQSFVWTGSYLLTWGRTGTGYRYDPATNAWTPLPSTNAPLADFSHTAVWTGTEMIVFGSTWDGSVRAGARYDLVTDAWTPISSVGGPPYGASVWTGTEMLVWNGLILGGWGATYRPATDTWSPIPAPGWPTSRGDSSVVWTGSEMIVWGGWGAGPVGEGSRYRPDTGTWTPVSNVGAPAPRAQHSAVWTGSRMIVFGGEDVNHDGQSTGGQYDPASDSWTPVSTTGAPTARLDHAAVWTGLEMIVWGGTDGTDTTATGARYVPASNAWTPTSLTNAPAARAGVRGVWTGGSMIVLGGNSQGGSYAFGQSRDLDGDGFSACTGDCDDQNAGAHPGGIEVCDGIDNDCNALPDDGIAPPGAIASLGAAKSGADASISWSATPSASAYDAVEGSLDVLASTSGNFTAATTGCVASTATTSTTWSGTPVPGDGSWVLVRGRNCALAPGTYDETSGSQQGSRDAEIAANGAACP